MIEAVLIFLMAAAALVLLAVAVGTFLNRMSTNMTLFRLSEQSRRGTLPNLRNACPMCGRRFTGAGAKRNLEEHVAYWHPSAPLGAEDRSDW